MTTHECSFPEEREPGGRLILAPCLICGLSGMDALKHLSASRAPGWLACSERMPEPREDVLAVWWQGGRCISFYDDQVSFEAGWWHYGAQGLKRATCPPTHWMPLPEPPKAEGATV